MGDFILERVNSNEKIILKRDETYTYGREKNNEIVRVSPMISRKHCVFIVTASSVKIIDSGSSNGVFLNGSQIAPHTPTHIKVNDIIGIACGDLQKILPESFVYKLKRQENEVPQKRKLQTEYSEIPTKIPKTEQRDSPEIVILDDDDVPVQNSSLSTMPPNTNNVIHPSLIKQEKNVANNHSSIEIELIDLEELEPISDNVVSTTNKQNNQQIPIGEEPQELVGSNSMFLKQEFIPTNVTSHQNMEKNELDSLVANVNFHFIKCEPTLPGSQDIFSESSPQPSTSNIKQEVTSSDLDYFDNHYSQTELICLNDDDEEEEINFPRSQLFDEIIISDEVYNDHVTSVKQEPMTALEEPIDSYHEPDDIPLIELTDDENDDDHEDDENTKAWLHKLMSSQLENQIVQIKVQPPEEEEEEEEERLMAQEVEESAEEQGKIREVEYGQLNDVTGNEVDQECIDSYFIKAVEELVDEIKEIQEESEDEDNQINSDIQRISSNENNVKEIGKKIVDSDVSNKNDTVINVQDKTENNNDTLGDEKSKNNKLTKKKKKKEKDLKIRNNQKSIKQSESTSDEISNLNIIEDLDNVSNKRLEKDTNCHDTNINDSLHKMQTVKPNLHTTMDKCDNHSKTKPYFVLTNHKYTKLHTNVERIEKTALHDKKSSKKKKRLNKNKNKKSTDSNKNSSEQINIISNRSLSSYEERDDSEAIEALQDTSISDKSDSTVETPKTGKCINIWNKKEKKIEQVDPPFFPKGERRAVSINITATTSGSLRNHSASSDDDVFTSNKTIASQKKEDKQTANDDVDKKEKKLKRLRYKFGGQTPSNIEKQKLSNEQKRKIKEERSEKLKQLQNKSNEMKMSEHKADTNKRTNKPKVKISEKNRGAFLTPDEINNDNIKKYADDSGYERFERLIIPKIQELQQNTAAQDLSDVISSSSVSFSNNKSLKSENKVKQKIGGKENYKETEKIDGNKETAMKKEKNKEIIGDNDNMNKNKPIITSDVSINLPNIKCYKEQRNTKKVIQPLRGILRDLGDNRTAPKKKVRFNDKTKIQTYLIDEGNKIEIKCTQKDMKIGKKFPEYNLSKVKVDCPKIESFLSKVFQWRPVWLNEQRDRETPPPIVDEKDISPVSLTYSSYTDYYKTMSTLMLLETWYIMSKDYELLRKRPVLYSSVVEQSVSQIVVDSSSDLKVTTFMIEALITEQALRQRQYPIYGDLVMLELAGIYQGKTNFTHVFAYINALNYTTITPHTRYNTALSKLTKNPHTLLTYTMMTKALPFTLQTLKPGRLKTVIYLRSHMRMVQALHYLPQSRLLEAILHPTPEAYKLPFVSNYKSLALVTKDDLNTKQRESVFRIAEAVVNQKPGIYLIQGPPGTGKSKVIINLITEILYGSKKNENQKFMKILVCAPSNAAIDEIVSRLKIIRSKVEDPAYKFKMVRIGRLEAVSSTVRACHVSELAKRDVDKTLADYHAAKSSSESIEKQKESLLTHIKALKEEYNAEDISEMQRQHLLRKLASFRAKYELFLNYNPSASINPKLLAKMHQAAENTILAGANIIACTLSSCYTNQMESIFGKSNGKISVCIVDEATQSSEPETLIPLMLGVTSLVLVGDPNQLPATIISQQAKQLGFDKSLFARIHSVFDRNPNSPVIMLNTQYRMSNRIMLFPNRYFYNDAIETVSPKERLPFHFYKVFNLSSHQDDSNKFSNTDEATFVANLIYTMVTNAHKIKNLGIGVITPYNDQRMLINHKIIDRMEHVPDEIRKKIVIEVNTVDSFQGQERDVVIMSCVRSHGIGFLSDRQRLCVALTRAKFSLVLCGNFKTFERDPMWFELLKDARDRNVYINLDFKAEPEKIKEYIIR